MVRQDAGGHPPSASRLKLDYSLFSDSILGWGFLGLVCDRNLFVGWMNRNAGVLEIPHGAQVVNPFTATELHDSAFKREPTRFANDVSDDTMLDFRLALFLRLLVGLDVQTMIRREVVDVGVLGFDVLRCNRALELRGHHRALTIREGHYRTSP